MGRVIGLIGLIGSGKGTVGDILRDEYGFVTESFAKPLKDAAALIFNWDRQMVEGSTKESREWREKPDAFWSKALEKEITPRLVLQWMGTEAGRNVFGKNLWTAALVNRLDPTKDYVITDVRFSNEVQVLRDSGALIVRIDRHAQKPVWMEEAKRLAGHNGPETYISWAEGTEVKKIHRSEWDWVNSPVDRVIDNDGTIEDLKKSVNYLLNTPSYYR